MTAYLRTVVLACASLGLAGTAVGQDVPKNLCANGGFELGRKPWRGTFTLDQQTTRSGRVSVRLHNPKEHDESIVSQMIVLDQAAAIPIVVSGWSKAESASGAGDNNYSLWCDVEYQNDVRPGRVDDVHIVPFQTGTHDWQSVETIFNPKHPIKHINFHALFRRVHSGTVWFDDLEIRPLCDGPLAAAAEDVPPADPHDPITRLFQRRLLATPPQEALVFVGEVSENGKASDVFAVCLRRQPRACSRRFRSAARLVAR